MWYFFTTETAPVLILLESSYAETPSRGNASAAHED